MTATLLAARGIAAPTSRSQSRSHAYFFCVLSHGRSRKRDTVRSLKFIWLRLRVRTLEQQLLNTVLVFTFHCEHKKIQVWNQFQCMLWKIIIIIKAITEYQSSSINRLLKDLCCALLATCTMYHDCICFFCRSSKKIYPVLGKTLSKLNTNSLISYGRSEKFYVK